MAQPAARAERSEIVRDALPRLYPSDRYPRSPKSQLLVRDATTAEAERHRLCGHDDGLPCVRVRTHRHAVDAADRVLAQNRLGVPSPMIRPLASSRCPRYAAARVRS
jgi:hypothetical protein